MKELVSVSVNGEFAKFIFLNETQTEILNSDLEFELEALHQATHDQLDKLATEITT